MAKLWGGVRGALSKVVRAGAGPEVPTRLRKQLVVTNLFAIMTGCITLFWFVVYKVFFETVMQDLMFAIIAISAVIPYLNHRGYAVTSRLLLLFMSTSSGAVYALALGPDAGIMIMFLPMVCAPLALFDLKERALVAVALPYPILLAVAVEWYQIDHGPMLPNASEMAINHAQPVSLITATIMVAGRLIVEECGGDLVVSSQRGHGTTLRVLLHAAHREEHAHAMERPAIAG